MTKSQTMCGGTSKKGKHAIDKLFRAVIKAEASDLHLKVGQPPKMRINSALKGTTGEILTAKRTEELVLDMMTEAQKEFFIENGTLDFAYQAGEKDRFRVSAFRQRGMVSLVARRITSEIPPFESLNLPPVVKTIADKAHDGLVLVTGPTGCGKSTTIASMIDHINRTRSCHIITIEDPIEFLHDDRKAIVSQREIGIDVASYGDALQSLMRQDPDVVMIGELRDSETLTAAMGAAGTGHLVFGTLNSTNAAQTVQRILDVFPPEERELARQTFSQSIRAIICQDLMPGMKKETKQVPVAEILICNQVVKKILADGRDAELANVIRSGKGEGMQDFTGSLRSLVEDDWIDLKVALQYAPNVEELKMALKGIRTS